jgi:hypothetical protein
MAIEPIRVAYADPPYPGQSAKHYADHPDFGGDRPSRPLYESRAGREAMSEIPPAAVERAAREHFDYLQGYSGPRWEEAHPKIRKEAEGRAELFLQAAFPHIAAKERERANQAQAEVTRLSKQLADAINLGTEYLTERNEARERCEGLADAVGDTLARAERAEAEVARLSGHILAEAGFE